MLSSLPQYAGAPHPSSASTEADEQDPAMFAAMTEEYSQAMLAARLNGLYSLWSADEAEGRQPRARFSTVMLRLRPNVRPRRRFPAQPSALPEQEPTTATDLPAAPEPAGFH
jgi:hypothetical protein